MRDFSPEPPLESDAPDIEKLPESATGLPAVFQSLQVSVREMGVAKTAIAWKKVNQVDGFDCPSCAWADPLEHRSVLEFCENGAKAFADDATQKLCSLEMFARRSVSDLASESDQWLNAQGRLTQPLLLQADRDHYEPVTYEAAFQLIAGEIKACATPNEAVFYTSGKAINESAFLFQLLARALGTNNLPDCSNMCHESSGVALKQSIGVGKTTVTLEDLEGASVIVVIGQNPGTNHPRMLTTLEAAKKRGARIIAINPLKEVGLQRFVHPQSPLAVLQGGTALADIYLQVRINGDVALLQGLAKSLIERDALDRAFLAEYTSGFDAYRAHLEKVTWDLITSESGLERAAIEEAAAVLAGSKGTVACWAMGLTQHVNAVDNVRELTNLLLLGGHIGRPNAGLFCVRGHSNVQGDRTMGVSEEMSESFYAGLEREFSIKCPRVRGYNTVQTIEAMIEQKVRVFVSLGGNFLSATPDTHAVAKGLRNCSLTVSIATKLNRAHLVTGRTAVILPCLSRTELDQPGSVENTVNWVSSTRGVFPPTAPGLMSEAAIIAGIADAALGTHWQNVYANNFMALRDKIGAIVPGFERFNERLADGGFYAPVAAKQRKFQTASGKAEFGIASIRPANLAAGQLLMTTIRTHDQFNTVVYGNDDRYRGVLNGRRVIFMHPQDLHDRGLSSEQVVNITSHFEGETRTVVGFRALPYDIPRGNAATYFPEANPLVPLRQQAEGSHTPASKSVVITVDRASIT